MSTRVGVIGATGYGGGELIRLLAQHPRVELVYVTSRTMDGQHVSAVHRNLTGLTGLRFEPFDADALEERCDLVFGALPHGASAEILAPLAARGMRVIDLSGDFRLEDPAIYERWYGREHPFPGWLGRFVYGSPEANRGAIMDADFVASPGCFATAINLALIPAARQGWVSGAIDVVAMTGSSGSGAGAKPTTHHPIRANTLRAYKVLRHQHSPECEQLVEKLSGVEAELTFTPISAPLVRGILAVVHVALAEGIDAEAVVAHYEDVYREEPFVRVVTFREPECAAVSTTNFAELRPRPTADGRLHVTVAIDNLVKGGAGQAVQAMNLMLGLSETSGLTWPGSWP